MEEHKVIGMMSGTSLDGVDLAYCSFTLEKEKWDFNIEKATTIKYTPDWKYSLKETIYKDENQIKKLDILYGEYLGQLCKAFIDQHKLKPDLIASHGHTIFHQPDQNFTLQIGDGEQIAKKTDITTVFNFRSLDVELGGQGAPLVPIGDKLLFSEFDFCLNLGGFSNISFDKNGQRIAFDISPVNIIINHLCKELDLDFDKDGAIAESGNINQELLSSLNNIEYYEKSHPKSLGIEYVIEHFHPLLKKIDCTVEDKLRTFYEHIAIQTVNILNKETGKSVLISGGGAYNKFLIDRIKNLTSKNINMPSNIIVDYKEALVFGLLGVLRYRNEINCLSSVTGASKDCSGGKISET